MSGGRRRRRAKQARRDTRRKAACQRDPLGTQKRDEESSVDTTFRDGVRRALRRHPVGLLSIASVMLNVARPDLLASPEGDPDYVSMSGLSARQLFVRLSRPSPLFSVTLEELRKDRAGLQP